jgi:hypothetical protein
MGGQKSILKGGMCWSVLSPFDHFYLGNIKSLKMHCCFMCRCVEYLFISQPILNIFSLYSWYYSLYREWRYIVIALTDFMIQRIKMEKNRAPLTEHSYQFWLFKSVIMFQRRILKCKSLPKNENDRRWYRTHSNDNIMGHTHIDL